MVRKGRIFVGGSDRSLWGTKRVHVFRSYSRFSVSVLLLSFLCLPMALRPNSRLRVAPAGFHLDPDRPRIPRFADKNFPSDMSAEDTHLYGWWLGLAALY